MDRDIMRKRWTVLLGGLVGLLCLGGSYAWSIFVAPLEETFGWVRTQTSMAFTLNIIFFSVGTVVTGYLSRRFSVRLLLALSAVLIGAGFFLTSLVSAPWQIYITYSLLCGVGIGMGYNCLISAVPMWFPERQGLITGVLLVGYAMSTALLGPTVSLLIGRVGVLPTFRILGAGCFAGVLVCALAVKKPNAEQIAALPRAKDGRKSAAKDVTAAQMVRRPVFWLAFIMLGTLSGIGLSLINHVTLIGSEGVGLSAGAAAAFVSINSVANAAGRVGGGWLYDRRGYRVTETVNCCLMCAGTALLLGAVVWQSALLFAAGAVLMMLGFGCNASMMPTTARSLFGEKYFSLNYSLLNTCSIMSAMFPTLVGSLRQLSGGYSIPAAVLFGLAVFTLAPLAALLHLHRKQGEAHPAA